MDETTPRGGSAADDGTPEAVSDLWGWRPRSWVPGRTLPIAFGVAIGLLLAQGVTAVLGRVQSLIVILVVSLFLSFAMEPAVQWMARRGLRRGFGTWIVFLGLILLLGGFFYAMANLVVDQVRNLLSAGPTLLGDLSQRAEQLLPADLGNAVADWLDEQQRELPRRVADSAAVVGRGAVGVGQTLLGGLFQTATIALVTFYLVADGPRLRQRLASRLEPHDQVRVLGLWELAIAKTGGYVYSRVLTAIASAIFHVAVFTAIGVDYALALGIWVGIVSSLIPAIGTYLAGFLPLVVALAESTGQAIWVLLAIVVYQQIENYLVVPRITATTLELHPAIAFMSVLAGGALAGATGALLALPAVAIVTALISASGEEYEVLHHHLLELGPNASPAGLLDEGDAARPGRDGPDRPGRPDKAGGPSDDFAGN
ncbi:AI-2E family transporter [Egicoccus sp. AB-alg6-2]|uniref:AI-2E family transporter n=1 Tax=Egicoccus sp. AB-alg6-2 TaxID=3242692 RepID=UPI00359EDEA6